MENSGIINLTSRRRRDYSHFYLTRNPFPAIGVPVDSPPFTADRIREKKLFQNIMTELLDNGSSQLTVVVGEYGSGKSHLF